MHASARPSGSPTDGARRSNGSRPAAPAAPQPAGSDDWRSRSALAPNNPWNDADAQAFLGARDAGVFVAVSAGNSGPGQKTIGSPADAPWLLAVGAGTHNAQPCLRQRADQDGWRHQCGAGRHAGEELHLPATARTPSCTPVTTVMPCANGRSHPAGSVARSSSATAASTHASRRVAMSRSVAPAAWCWPTTRPAATRSAPTPTSCPRCTSPSPMAGN